MPGGYVVRSSSSSFLRSKLSATQYSVTRPRLDVPSSAALGYIPGGGGGMPIWCVGVRGGLGCRLGWGFGRVGDVWEHGWLVLEGGPCSRLQGVQLLWQGCASC